MSARLISLIACCITFFQSGNAQLGESKLHDRPYEVLLRQNLGKNLIYARDWTCQAHYIHKEWTCNCVTNLSAHFIIDSVLDVFSLKGFSVKILILKYCAMWTPVDLFELFVHFISFCSSSNKCSVHTAGGHDWNGSLCLQTSSTQVTGRELNTTVAKAWLWILMSQSKPLDENKATSAWAYLIVRIQHFAIGRLRINVSMT